MCKIIKNKLQVFNMTNLPKNFINFKKKKNKPRKKKNKSHTVTKSKKKINRNG